MRVVDRCVDANQENIKLQKNGKMRKSLLLVVLTLLDFRISLYLFDLFFIIQMMSISKSIMPKETSDKCHRTPFD